MFPVIKTIDDILPHVSGDVGIFCNRHADYDVIDYAYVLSETFDRPERLECRGLKFAKDGSLIARPFHKFFNLGERQGLEAIDWSRSHLILGKLDGSMVHPCMINGELVFMTRSGLTAQSALALSHADEGVRRLCAEFIGDGLTCMFEFTSPDNRIVLAYEQPTLTLLAARDNTTGIYLSHSQLSQRSAAHKVRLVEPIPAHPEMTAFVALARAQADIEGYVIAFDDGHRLKLKTDYYALRHKALSGLAFEKNVLLWVVQDVVDDIVPLLAPRLADRLRAYQTVIEAGLSRNCDRVRQFVAAHAGLERRAFALAVQQHLDRRLQPVAFSLLDGKDGRVVLKRQLESATHSETRVEELRDLYGMAWDCRDIDLDIS